MKSPILLDLPMPIRTPRILIRHPIPGDGPELNRTISESFDRLNQWMPWAHQMPTPEDSEIFVRQAHAEFLLRKNIHLSIFEAHGKTLLGATGLTRMNWEIPSFEIGYWARTTALKNGYITEAVNAVTRYAFEIFHAKRVEIRCDAENTRSLKVAERLGYELEGRLKQNELTCQREKLRDTLVFSRIDSKGLPELEVSFGEQDPNYPILETPRTCMRLPSHKDLPNILAYYSNNKSHLIPWEPKWPDNFLTEAVWQERISDSVKEFKHGTAVKFFIFDKDDNNSIIGTINFSALVRGSFQACFLGYSLAQNKMGYGLMTEALQTAIQYMFTEQNIHKIMANYMPENSHSEAVLNRLGFRREGISNDYLYIQEQWRDHVLTSLNNPRWSPVCQ